jgi:hypothetical protein
LLDPDLMGPKGKAEADFREYLRLNAANQTMSSPPSPQDLAPNSFATAAAAYGRIADATALLAGQAIPYSLLEGAQGFNCDSFRLARILLRAGEERPKPNGERLREYSDSGKISLELSLFSEKPIYTDLEILTLSDSLTFLAAQLGATNEFVQKVLAGKSPHERAVELITTTKVRDTSFRKRLYEGGAEAVTAARDPMIELARLADPPSRALRKLFEEQGEIKQQAHAAIARARNATPGGSSYPDATFTLRLAFGTVQGYEEDGKPVSAITTMAGLYQRAKEMGGRAPFDLPAIWEKRKSSLKMATPLNFVSTCDIIGGNSGSPVVNRAGEFVGIIFDGNLESLPWDYAFSDKQGRATSVASAAILEALNQVYQAKALARELVTGHRPK